MIELLFIFFFFFIPANILSVQSQKKALEKSAERASEKTASGGGSGSSNSNNNGYSNTQTISSKQNANKAPSTANHKVIKEKSDPYECPNTSDFTFFPQYCSKHTDCTAQGREMRCCRQFNSKRCVKGVPKPLKEQRHERKLILFILFVVSQHVDLYGLIGNWF